MGLPPDQWLGAGYFASATNCAYSAFVTSVLSIWKEATVTECGGASAGSPPARPTWNVPPGIATNSGLMVAGGVLLSVSPWPPTCVPPGVVVGPLLSMKNAPM